MELRGKLLKSGTGHSLQNGVRALHAGYLTLPTHTHTHSEHVIDIAFPTAPMVT
jgi:hypothetical protein